MITGLHNNTLLIKFSFNAIGKDHQLLRKGRERKDTVRQYRST